MWANSRKVELVADNCASLVIVVKEIIANCAIGSVVEDVNKAETSVRKKYISVCCNEIIASTPRKQ